MAVRRLAEPSLQPESFAFTAENRDWARREITKYPPGREQSAIIPLLWRAQEQAGGWLPQVEVNVNLLCEVAPAVRLGIGAVGLYRSEFLFLARRRPLATSAITLGEATPQTYKVRKRGARTRLTGGVVRSLNTSDGHSDNDIVIAPNPNPDAGARTVFFAYEGDSNVVDVHVANLRRKLELPGHGDPIETVRGVGYRVPS